ncbi:MAG: aminopeptidase P family protein [Acidobacteriota bacterium]|nr:MAG: aminopeptidase P family protein [Acidobacteriota bacterium]
MIRKFTLVLFILSNTLPAFAVEPMPNILPHRERARVMDQWLERRLETVVPQLMRREGIDMWILIAREYNEDPVMETMLPATWLSARRRTILVFFDAGPGTGLERLSVSRYGVGTFFESAWDKEKEPDQWKCLADIIAKRSPSKIGLNRSTLSAHADGLSSTEYESFIDSLPGKFRERIVSAEKLAIGWLETRIPEEMEVYPTLCRIAHRIIAEGLSLEGITPGVTTTGDLEWWYRDRIQSLGLSTWFHPSVSVQRKEEDDSTRSFADRAAEKVIRSGDLIHIDFGITYLGLNTDTQQHAYVLRRGEEQAPAGLQQALKNANRLQDIVLSHFQTGRTGNTILKQALLEARMVGLKPSIYTHPLGFHGHAAGPTIGLWDQQDGVPGDGDYPLYPNTAYSIELNATTAVPEWDGQDVRIMLEEDAFFDGETIRFIDGRQTQLHLIPRSIEGLTRVSSEQ